jgi:hypothetical protein
VYFTDINYFYAGSASGNAAKGITLRRLIDYEGKQAILAYAGGEPAASFGSLRLVVPGDAHGGRSVREVESIEVH